MTDLHISTPCHESWSAMTPAGHGRHCAACDKTVVDLTSVPVAAVQPLLASIHEHLANGRRVCVRAHADRDGRLRAVARRGRLLTNSLAGILAVALAGCHGSGPEVITAANTDQTAVGHQVATTAPTALGAITDIHRVATPPPTGLPTETPNETPTSPMMGDVCALPPPPPPAIPDQIPSPDTVAVPVTAHTTRVVMGESQVRPTPPRLEAPVPSSAPLASPPAATPRGF